MGELELQRWMQSKLGEYRINALYYFSLLANTDSILVNGIYPKNLVNSNNINYSSFANEEVQALRHDETRRIKLSDNCWRSIHDLVPLYLTPKTPTLSAVRRLQDNIVFFIIDPRIITESQIAYAFSDGNAASLETQFFYSLNKLNQIPWEVIRAKFWIDHDDGKRKRNAEFLIYPHVANKYIKRIVTKSQYTQKKVVESLKERRLNIPIQINNDYFF